MSDTPNEPKQKRRQAIDKQHDISYSDIIETFGIERQCRQAMEECAELIQAINKAVRYPDDPKRIVQLVEEIEDVKIMILQLEEMFNVNWRESERMFCFKKKRLFDRFEKERRTVVPRVDRMETREEHGET